MHLSAFSLCGADLDEAAANIGHAGFEHMALYFSPGRLPCELEDMTDADAAQIMDKLAGHGLTAIAAGGGSNVATQDGLDMLVRKLDGAAKLGVGLFDTGSLSTKNMDDATIASETAAFIDGMTKAGDAAAERGITICLETHGGLTGTVASSLALMERLAHPNVKIGYDPANIVFYEGADPLDRLTAFVPHIGHVHAKDKVGGKGEADFPTVGKGELPYPRIVAVLVKAGYSGYLSVERASGDTPEQRGRELKDAQAYLSALLE